MRWLNPSATLNFRKPSMAVDMESATLFLDELRVLRFIRNSSDFENVSTAVRWANKKPEYIVLWFSLSSGDRIRTYDLRVMSKKPESVLFVRRALQISQTGERWFFLARHAAIVDKYSYSIVLVKESQVLFCRFLTFILRFNSPKFHPQFNC